METNKARLIELYARSSKHSNYQVLPGKLTELLDIDDIKIKTRYETERLDYILQNIEITNKNILDIGGNTGYFSIEMLNNGAKTVHYFEGNSTHAEFVELASKLLMLDNRLQITNEYFLFKGPFDEKYDITLLLNVLHHIGDDYGDQSISIENAKNQILRQLNSLASMTKIMVFQLGFNWKGNRYLGLFQNGTKQELIDFVVRGTQQYWEISKIGVPELINNRIKYVDLNNTNIQRQDNLGEFLNRPIFIMRSAKC